jgi:5-methylcytosine-specific restriction endonuclease McrA
MSGPLIKATVLGLNRNWQAINVRTPGEAFCMMGTNVATALETEGEDRIAPVTWEERITLPIRDQDEAVRTVRDQIRVPTVIVAVNYAKVPKERPKLCAGAIRERDGNRCQYTGRVLRPQEDSLDRVVPRSRRGKDAWESVVWPAKEVNQREADRLPHEAGLKLLSIPRAPRELPVSGLSAMPAASRTGCRSSKTERGLGSPAEAAPRVASPQFHPSGVF